MTDIPASRAPLDERPTREFAALMGVDGEELDYFPSRASLESPPTYQPWDQAALGRTLRNWAAAYAFVDDPARADRLQHNNGTYVEINYSHRTVTLRWGTAPRAGAEFGQEGEMRIVQGSLRIEQRDAIDAIMKELATRE